MDFELSNVTGSGSDKIPLRNNRFPPEIEQGFRWIRETISLIYTHHRHPWPMVALIFMYAETFGKVLCRESGMQDSLSSARKVSQFVEKFMPKLWNALDGKDKSQILGDFYRNGLVHQLFMKRGHAIHEDKSGDTSYISFNVIPYPMSINIDHLVPEFQDGLAKYYRRLETEANFLKVHIKTMSEK